MHPDGGPRRALLEEGHYTAPQKHPMRFRTSWPTQASSSVGRGSGGDSNSPPPAPDGPSTGEGAEDCRREAFAYEARRGKGARDGEPLQAKEKMIEVLLDLHCTVAAIAARAAVQVW